MKNSGELEMAYSEEMAAFTTWLMAGGGIILFFSLVACLPGIARGASTGVPKVIALVGFWIAFYGAYMDPRLGAYW